MSFRQIDSDMQIKNSKEVSFSTKIVEIKMDDFVVEELVKSKSQFNLDNFQYEFNAGIGIDLPRQELTVKLNTNIYSEIEKKNKIGHINSHGIFYVVNFSDILKDWENKIPNFVLASFIGIVLSTTRGFLIDKSQDTLIEGAMIPIVNPLTFFPEK